MLKVFKDEWRLATGQKGPEVWMEWWRETHYSAKEVDQYCRGLSLIPSFSEDPDGERVFSAAKNLDYTGGSASRRRPPSGIKGLVEVGDADTGTHIWTELFNSVGSDCVRDDLTQQSRVRICETQGPEQVQGDIFKGPVRGRHIGPVL